MRELWSRQAIHFFGSKLYCDTPSYHIDQRSTVLSVMGDAGFFKVRLGSESLALPAPSFCAGDVSCHLLTVLSPSQGTSADQDTRFSNKQKKLMKSMKFPPEFDQKVRHSDAFLPHPRAGCQYCAYLVVM